MVVGTSCPLVILAFYSTVLLLIRHMVFTVNGNCSLGKKSL